MTVDWPDRATIRGTIRRGVLHMVEPERSRNDSYYHEARSALSAEDVRLTAPESGRTESTALLLWNRPVHRQSLPADAVRFRVWCNGQEAVRTSRLSCTLRDLDPDTEYAVRVAAELAGEGLDTARPVDPVRSSGIVRIRTKTAPVVVDVRSHGAAGDGSTDDTASVQRAIDGCPPGGVVLVPAGTYRIGTIRLASNTTLRLGDGAVLSLLDRAADREKTEERFPLQDFDLDGPDGPVPYRSTAAIRATGVENIAIVGQGTILGNGGPWWKRVSGYTGMRPYMLELVDCRDVLLQGVTFQDSPTWNVHALYCSNVIVNEVSIRKIAAGSCNNGDGVNPDSSRNVLIVGCTFATHDDSVAIKSGKRDETNGYRRQRPCEDVVIRDCTLDGTMGSEQTGAISLGSEMSGGIRRVLVTDCTFYETSGLVCLKTMRGRGGEISEVLVRNIRHSSSGWHHKSRGERAAIKLDMLYWEPDTLEPRPVDAGTPRFSDVAFEDIHLRQRNGWGIYAQCLPEMPARGVVFRRVRGRCERPCRLINVSDVVMEDIVLSGLA